MYDSRLPGRPDLVDALDQQMTLFISDLFRLLEEKVEQHLDESEPKTDDVYMHYSELAFYANPERRRQVSFWHTMAKCAVAFALKDSGAPPVQFWGKLSIWFDQHIAKAVTEEFCPSCPLEEAQIFAIIGEECFKRIHRHIPISIVSSAILSSYNTLKGDELRKNISEGIVRRDSVDLSK